MFQCKSNASECFSENQFLAMSSVKFLFFLKDFKISMKDPCTFLHVKEIIIKEFKGTYRFLLEPLCL